MYDSNLAASSGLGLLELFDFDIFKLAENFLTLRE